ncbi:hypothetical protein Y032_0177g606 [Ancylostoma ceylanicum]|uniref:Uncharacterized protein n=1 Tax=Ancylostoma ceylanicum TaxID=53326 RepID=A0A016STC7_9BILA|nr:hypothetical protein Y032_0177g606 [Ancylostoma ceylanicum]
MGLQFGKCLRSTDAVTVAPLEWGHTTLSALQLITDRCGAFDEFYSLFLSRVVIRTRMSKYEGKQAIKLTEDIASITPFLTDNNSHRIDKTNRLY